MFGQIVEQLGLPMHVALRGYLNLRTISRGTPVDLFIYGASDDLVEFVALEGEFYYAIDLTNHGQDKDDYPEAGKKAAEYPVYPAYGTPVTFTIGDVLKVQAIYDGTWSFAVGMVEEGMYPRWGKVETGYGESYTEDETPSHTMSVTIRSIPDKQAYIKRVS